MLKQLSNQEFNNHPVVKLINNSQIDRNERLKQLFEDRINLSIRDEDSRTLIHHIIDQMCLEASYCQVPHNLYDMLDTILSYEQNLINKQERTGMAPIAQAVEIENAKLVEILFKHGANPNDHLNRNIILQVIEKDENNQINIDYKAPSLLLYTVDHHNKVIAKLILQQPKLEINLNEDYTRDPEFILELFDEVKGDYTLLNRYRQIFRTSEEELKELLLDQIIIKDNFVDDNFLRTYQSSMLEKALDIHKDKSASNSYQRIKQFIKDNKLAGLKLIDIINNSSLDTDEKTERLSELLQNNSDIWWYVQDKDYFTALQYAVIQDSWCDSMTDYDEVNIIDENDNIITHEFKEYKLSKLLIDSGFNINIGSKSYCSALHCALSVYNPKLMTRLILAGADINVKNEHGEMILHYTIRKIPNKSHYLAKFFIICGVDIDNRTNKGKTALHYAYIYAKDNIQILLDNGANPNIKDDDGKTILDYAIDQKNTKIINMLVKAGAKINQKASSRLYSFDQDNYNLLIERNHVQKEIRKKINARICYIFDHLIKTDNFENDYNQLSKDDKLTKCVNFDDNNKKLFVRQVRKVEDNEPKLGWLDNSETRITGRETVKVHNALETIKERIKNSRSDQIIYKERIRHRLSKFEQQGKVRSR